MASKIGNQGSLRPHRATQHPAATGSFGLRPDNSAFRLAKILPLLGGLLTLPSAFAQNPPPPNAAVEKVAQACNAFGFKLLAQTRKSFPDANVFLSPAGLALALAMVENGAGGDTLKQIAQTLQLDGLSLPELNSANQSLLQRFAALNPQIKLEIANGLWTLAGAPIKPDFISVNRKFYQAEVSSLDFQNPSAVKTINDWVGAHTGGKIPEIVTPPLTSDLRLLLVDAIYFKGEWAVPFNKKSTHDLPFTLATGQAIQHPRMSQTGRLAYFENARFQAVALPYAGRQVSLYVFLPRQNLDQFLPDLTPENWQQWTSRFSPRQGTLQLPRFKLEKEYDLNATLKAMGVSRPFSSQADFSGISRERLAIGWVKQKTFIEVNEEGTEAAAATGIGIRPTMVMRQSPPFTMIVDKPFYVAIRENRTGTLLFQGAITDPRSP